LLAHTAPFVLFACAVVVFAIARWWRHAAPNRLGIALRDQRRIESTPRASTLDALARVSCVSVDLRAGLFGCDWCPGACVVAAPGSSSECWP
jgi:hypothetical protein